MKETLIIKNFGPIKDVNLELGRFNVLIGEQATGKSTVAKLLAVCRYFSYIHTEYGKFDEGLFEWGLGESAQEDSYIEYRCQHYTLKAENRRITITQPDGLEVPDSVFLLTLSDLTNEFRNLLIELEKIRPKFETNFVEYVNWTIPTSFFQNDVSRVMDNPFYLPAERGLQSIFSLGKSSIQNTSDALFNQLANLDRIARIFKNETLIEPLDIIYKNVDGRGYIKKLDDDKFYSLFNAATGYQSTIPVVLLLKYYSDIRKKKKTFIIEEIELNLYPTAQRRLVYYLSERIINSDNSVLLTTHSPYILTSLNNLLYAYQLGRINPIDVEKIVEGKYWLNSDDVSVYRLLADGTAKEILDKELNQIDAGEIDEVSRINNKEWGDLLKIEANG